MHEPLRWAVGVTLLLVIDFLAEAVVFEWLQWNGTTKNDWFFLLWWLIVAGWTVFSARRIWQAMSKSRTRAAGATHQIKRHGRSRGRPSMAMYPAESVTREDQHLHRQQERLHAQNHCMQYTHGIDHMQE